MNETWYQKEYVKLHPEKPHHILNDFTEAMAWYCKNCKQLIEPPQASGECDGNAGEREDDTAL